MAFATIHDEGVKYVLTNGLSGGTNIRVKLFKNNFTPTRANVAADFVEADFDGYAHILWAVDPMTVDVLHRVNLPPKLAEWIGPPDEVPQDIYGWYVVNIDSNKVIMSARFAAPPKVMGSPADTIKIDLALRAKDLHG